VHVLLNWLVQGSIVSAAAAVTLRVVPVSRTQVRYHLVCVAMVLVVAVPVLSVVTATSADTQPAADHMAYAASSSTLPILTMPDAWWTSTTFALVLWLTWAIFRAARIVVDTFAICRARREGDEVSADVLTGLKNWSRLRKTGRTARIVVSHDVRAAAVLGWGSPVIALSPALVRDLTAEDLDRVIAHEWAHVQRYDDIVRGFQAFVRIVAGWHPAVRWLHGQIEVEREVACDEMAVAATGSAKAYATCLTTLAARPVGSASPLPALSAVSASGLHDRVVRILAVRGEAPPRRQHGLSLATSTAIVAVTVAVVNLQIVDSAAAAVGASVNARSIAHTPPSPSATPAIERVEFAKPETARLRTGSSAADTAETRDDAPPLDEVTQVSEETAPVPIASTRTELTGTPIPAVLSVAAPAPSLGISRGDDRNDDATAAWTGAVNAGLAIGRGSQNAGIATGRAVSRFGKRVAGSF